jgi:hypothetical protein
VDGRNREVFQSLMKRLYGKVSGDKGSISQPLLRCFWITGFIWLPASKAA